MSALESSALESSAGSALPPRRVPRLFSCLVKGPLGCLFFLIGAAIVLVLLLPPAGGRLAERLAEKWFAERHQGRLELADAWIGSFYGEQRIDSVILRDPEGDEVLRATLRAPSLSEFFHEADSARRRPYGPVVLRVANLRLVQAADGSTNLARALAERVREDVAPERRGGLSTDQPMELALELWIERLRYADKRGHEGVLDGVKLSGTLHWGPYETRLSLAGGPQAATPEDTRAPVRARFEFTRRAGDAPGTWESALELTNAPSVLAGLLVAAAAPLVPCAGARLDELAWERDGKRVSLRLADAGSHFELKGALEKGLVAGEEGAAQLELACAGELDDELLTRLLPFLSAVECEQAEAHHSLRLAHLRWPLDGAWSELSGELEFVPAGAHAELVPSLAALLAGAHPSSARLDGRRLDLRVHAGQLEYAPLRLALEDGWLELAGTLELARGILDVHLSGERAGQPFDLGRLAGTGAALAPRPAELAVPPEAPAAPEALTPEGAAPQLPARGG